MTINELREKRNQAWNAAKAFVETKRDKDGLLSNEDSATYAQMEKKVQDYGTEIERMEAMAAMEAQLSKPTSAPITEKPLNGKTTEDKQPKSFRATDAYRSGIQDKLYSLSSLDLYFTVPQGTPLIALRKKKVGINTPDPQATLDVDGNIHMNGVNVHGKMGRVDGSTTDLNNVKTPGYYFAYSASTEKHFPTTTIGMLEVFLPESYFIQQRYTVYDGSRMYIRGNYGGTWSSWHTVSLTAVR